MKPTVVDIKEIESHFADYSPLIRKGQTILLYDEQTLIAEIRPSRAHPALPEKRPSGLCQGEARISEDFNEPDPELEAQFNDRPLFPGGTGQ
jgi:hypothetical protein